jgi:hypothetical protein
VLVAAAVCPHPPLLIPAACGGMTGSGDDLAGPDAVLAQIRAASLDAVAGLLDAGPDLIVAVGAGPDTAAFAGDTAGGLAAYGVSFQTGTGPPVLPLSLTVGAWLLRTALGLDRTTPAIPSPAKAAPAVRFQSVAAGATPDDCARLGAGLATAAPRTALLVLGDATARRAIGVPGQPDPVAEAYDEEVAEALAAADLARLLRLAPERDAELAVAGRAAWQVLAGAAASPLHGTVLARAAPYDVCYLVASWTAADAHR